MKTIKITENLTMIDEGHVGGFLIEKDPATFTPKLWKYICVTYDIKSVIDVGCGMGHALAEFSNYGINVIGVDGSDFVKTNSPHKDKIIYHDFTKNPLRLDQKFDLCWSSEFVEHVEERYVENFLETFSSAKYLAITYADEGQEGHHHVNCRNKNYWISVIESKGFVYDEVATQNLKNIAYLDALDINPQYRDNHFFNRGLFFVKNEN